MNKGSGFKEIKNSIWVIAVSFIILIIVCLSMWWKMRDIIDTQLEHHVAEQGSMLSNMVNNSFGGDLQLLSEVTSFVNM